MVVFLTAPEGDDIGAKKGIGNMLMKVPRSGAKPIPDTVGGCKGTVSD